MHACRSTLEDPTLAEEVRARDRLFDLNETLLARAAAQQAISLREVLLGLVEIARQITGARYGALGVLGRDGRSIKDFVYSGVDEETVRAIGRLPSGGGLLGAVIWEARPIRVADLGKDARGWGFPPGHPRMTSFIGLPLRVGSRVFGNLYLADKEGGLEFSAADEALLVGFSRQAGLTVAFARQFQDEEQQLLEAVVEHAPHGLAYFPADPSAAPFGNGAAQSMLGRVTRAHDPGCTYALLHGDGRALGVDEFPVGRALREGAVVNLEVLLYRLDSDQPPRPTLISAAPVCSSRGETLGVVIVLQDISSRKNLERLREDFAAMVAHDLRTPLQAVLLQVEALLDQARGGVTAVGVSALQRIRANGRRLETLVRDLLDASRIDGHQVVLERRPVDLGTMVASLVHQIEASLGNREIRLAMAAVAPIAADPLRVEQIVTNLLENAAKYSAEKEPILLGLEARGEGVELSVQDRGPGIAPEDVPHLFDRYYQARRARAARSGLGLGLYITRGLVEAHGGHVVVESTPGEGSTFRVWLPAGEAAAP